MKQVIVIAGTLALSAAAAELPVRSVVLYKHGVGYFERSGELGAGESARLDFKASEMNDVLKSLTLSATGQDKVVALRYDASEPVEKKLENFPMRLGERQPLSYLLDQLKGEQLELKFGNETITGTIVGARLLPASERRPESEQVTLLLPSGEFVTRDLSAASSIRFLDAELQLQFKDYLAVLTGARSQERRSVYIDSTDTGRRRISASYMIPAPVWKSSYRLIFTGDGQPSLEGWAIVDNTTEDDWNKVSLALVSGRPISFVTQLYEPKYVDRPEVELPEEGVTAPIVHEGGISGGVAPQPEDRAAAARRRMQAMAPQEMAAAPALAEAPAAGLVLAPSTVAATAEARELGELFEYSFDAPVTVRRNESAMLPFLQQKIEARKLLIYSDQSLQHPLNAAELTNGTGKTLDGGPITVFDSGAYGGEALMETLKTGDKRLISYGVDLGTRITTAFDSDRSLVREVHVRRGILTAKSAIRETRTYTVRNVDQKKKTLIVEHLVRQGYDLISPQPKEKTSNLYRFEVALASGGTEKVPVVEERELENTYALVNQTPDFLATFIQNKEISDKARQELERVAAQKRRIAETDSEIQRVEKENQELAADQARIRENIASLNRVSGQQEQVQKYAAQLAEQEKRLAGLRDRLSELRSRRETLQQELNRMIEAMDF